MDALDRRSRGLIPGLRMAGIAVALAMALGDRFALAGGHVDNAIGRPGGLERACLERPRRLGRC